MTPEPAPRHGLLDKALVRNNGIARRMMVALLLFSTAITAIITTVELYLDYRVDLRGIEPPCQDDDPLLIDGNTEHATSPGVWSV